MTWEEFRESARALGAAAAQKVNELTDTAALRVRLATVEARLKNAYATFGRTAYQHFTADASTPDELAEQVRAIALLEAEAESLKKEISDRKNEENGRNSGKKQ